MTLLTCLPAIISIIGTAFFFFVLCGNVHFVRSLSLSVLCIHVTIIILSDTAVNTGTCNTHTLFCFLSPWNFLPILAVIMQLLYYYAFNISGVPYSFSTWTSGRLNACSPEFVWRMRSSYNNVVPVVQGPAPLLPRPFASLRTPPSNTPELSCLLPQPKVFVWKESETPNIFLSLSLACTQSRRWNLCVLEQHWYWRWPCLTPSLQRLEQSATKLELSPLSSSC